jgi:UDP-N-acetylglucosamine--N-acetylmuramyl-(pentapeptide) pyrophosphoryl-undecaprenol N-acetylglucosamine transferase
MKYCVLVAGGTGGHINAALTLGRKFQQEGREVLYLTGMRPLDYKLFPRTSAVHLRSRTIRSLGPLGMIRSLLENLISFLKVCGMFLGKRPAFVVGCGGYVCGPVLMAAFVLGIRSYIIEQNSVVGLTNRILGFFSKKIFTHFRKTRGIPSMLTKKIVVTGNPVRPEFAKSDFAPPNKKDGLNVLVFGGSLGAREINELIETFARGDSPYKVSVRHQIGGELSPGLLTVRPGKNVIHERFSYLENIHDDYKWAHIIVARSGASTIAELRVVGKPVLLIPYPRATDDHQALNALFLREEAPFKVYVEPVEVLRVENCGKLKKIFEEVLVGDPLPRPTSDAMGATEMIFREISSDVQK